MPEDKISYQLSPFEKIEIVRAELEEVEEQLKETEARLRGVHFEVERLRFLAGITKAYAKSAAPEGYSELEKLEAKRKELKEKIKALREVQPKFEAEAIGGVAPRAAPSAAKRSSAPGMGFQSFDDFRGKRKPKK